MKKYMFCFLLFAATSILCFGVIFYVGRSQPRIEKSIPDAAMETETLTDAGMVVNQQDVEPVIESVEEDAFYLVSEGGFLLVFSQDQSTVCLYTHMPLADFPEEEQDKLRQGIWFTNMMDIFNYLESYTS